MTKKTRAALVSVCSNITLIIMKIFAGILSGSVSIISEAIHSAMDLVAALIALVAVRKSDIPPDQRHPYGHDKIENVSGVIEALLILLAAGWIIFEAVGKLITPTPIEGWVSVCWSCCFRRWSTAASPPTSTGWPRRKSPWPWPPMHCI